MDRSRKWWSSLE